ncbi:MAG: hypothetical protein M3065_22665 [Actinomycetota bacterium]|nr:hypothetical protein [Actinomycetota bacterium]
MADWLRKLPHQLGYWLAGTALVLVIGAAWKDISGVLDGNRPSAAPLSSYMSGDLNLAVAGFTSHGRVTVDGTAFASDAAVELRSKLRALAPDLHIQVRGPSDIAQLPGLHAVSSTAGAGALSSRIGADIVVFGDLEPSATGTQLAASFYLDQRKLPAAQELAGQYSYGRAIALPYSIDANPQSRARLRDELVARASSYAAAFLGVGYYLTHGLAAAASYLHRALGHSPGGSVTALLELFQGNVAAQRGAPAAARSYYAAASHDSLIHTRAEVGLSEVLYETSHHACTHDTANVAGLYRGRRILAALPSGAGHDVVTNARINFGLGQIDLCLSAAQMADRWGLAQHEFTAVIQAYRYDAAPLRDDTAESYAALGLIGLSTHPSSRAVDSAARLEYRAADSTTTITARRSFFLSIVGYLDERLREFAVAATDYRLASQSAPDATTRKRYDAASANASHHR